MALFKEQTVLNRAAKEMQRPENLYKSESRVLNEAVESYSKGKSYDIFLSHSVKDSKLVLGMKGIFEDLGYSVYVDWVDDPQLDRSQVNKDTAAILRERMKSSKSLFFVTTKNTDSSKWMPWECGYFDGFKEKVAIVPIEKQSYSNEYKGQEYLGLYPYCVQSNNTNGKSMLWIHKNKSSYISYDTWVVLPNDKITWKRTG